MQSSTNRREVLKKTVITLIAMFGYGGWAYYSNLPANGESEMLDIAFRAGIIQGGYSAILTLTSIILLEAVLKNINHRLTINFSITATLIIVGAAQYAIIIPVHLANSTPNILITLLPGFIIGTLFNFAYLLSIKNKYVQ
ncbi:hypothetical protein N9L91_00290 [Pseudomonadales bacterium]|nr:hypothetical protein [Pseudomonadales bacterium]MDG1937726.1 hypothetical protein [Pseudomonadales bacterium]